MRNTILKPLRRAVALLFLVSTALLFSGLAVFLPVKCVLWLQFIPSLLNFTAVVSLSSAGFIVVVISALLFGRVYCSFICLLGILQDVFIRVSAVLLKKTNTYKRPLYVISFLILGICILPLFFRNIIFLNLLDPFGISGRIFAGFQGSLLLSAILLLVFAVFGSLKNRWYCNVICPLGVVLGLLSRLSFFRIRIEGGLCAACGSCEGVCKSNCIDYRSHRLDFDRCVGCMNCLGSCPEKAISFRAGRDKKKTPAFAQPAVENNSRRNFIKTSAMGVATVSGLLPVSGLFTVSGRLPETLPVMPPGAVNLWHFTEKCTACQLCVSSCPTRVLQPSFFEYGLSGLFQPKLDFERSFCKYDCIKCTEVCPSGAIQPLGLYEKQRTQTGLAVFAKNQCLVVEKQKPCAKCSEHCPAKAIEMLPYLGKLRIPKVDPKLCNGCGACEFYCPVRPEKAISVEANAYQRLIW